jgi:uncharacterized membrane protein HdeD (DUF308 family)
LLLILSGIVDIAIGILVLTGALPVRNAPLPVFLICFVIGFVYLAAGLIIAIVKMKKQKD